MIGSAYLTMSAAFNIEKGVAVIPPGTTRIDNFAFYKCGELESVTIPDSVTEIGDFAFMDCHNLRNIHLPGSLIKIGRWCFALCRKLVIIEVPESVTEIGRFAFRGCMRLRRVFVSDANILQDRRHYNNYTVTESVLDSQGNRYSKDFRELYKGANIRKVTIDDRCETICDGAFVGCSNLEEIRIPDSVKSIGEDAFWDCTNLVRVDIPDSVTEIGDYAFSGCTSLPGNAAQDQMFALSNCQEETVEYMDVYGIQRTLKVVYDKDLSEDDYDGLCMSFDGIKTLLTWSSQYIHLLGNVIYLRHTTGMEYYLDDDCLKYIFLTGTGKYFLMQIRRSSFTVFWFGFSDEEETFESQQWDKQWNNERYYTESYCFEGLETLAEYYAEDYAGEYLGDVPVEEGEQEKEIQSYSFFTDFLDGYCGPFDDHNWGPYDHFAIDIDLEDLFNDISVDQQGNVYAWNGEVLLDLKEREDNIIVPDCRYIENQAFSGYSRVNDIEIPESVIYICEVICCNRLSIKSMSICKGVFERWVTGSGYDERLRGLESGYDTFSDIRGLKSLNLPNAFMDYLSSCYYQDGDDVDELFAFILDNFRGVDTFTNDYKTLLCFFGNNGNYLPESVDTIGPLAFSLKCDFECADFLNLPKLKERFDIESLVIPNSVKEICWCAFQECKCLKSIVIPDSVTKIGDRAFKDCTGLTSIVMGASVKEIDKTAFDGCSALKTITVPKGKTAFFHSILPSELHSLIEEKQSR